jgi:hypothetical protein
MSLVLAYNTQLQGDGDPFARYPGVFGVDTIFRRAGATVTASAEAGGAVLNATKEGLTHDFWRPGAAGEQWARCIVPGLPLVNYLGIAAHDLHARGATVKAQYSTDGGSSWVDASSDFMPADSSPLMILFDDVEAGAWRVRVFSAEAVSIGVIHLGKALRLPSPIGAGFTPPYWSRTVRYATERAERGAFTGRTVISQGADLRLNVRGLDPAWIRAEWEPTLRQIEQFGFFFAAQDVDGAAGIEQAEVLYAWATDQPGSSYTSTVTGALTINAAGILS